MVQVLPKVRSFGEDFGRAIGMGAGEGISSAMENRKKMADLAKEDEQIYQETGIRLHGIKDPEMRKTAFSKQLEGNQKYAKDNKINQAIEKKYGKEAAELYSSLTEGGKTKYLEELLEGDRENKYLNAQFGEEETPQLQQETQQKFEPKKAAQKAFFEPEEEQPKPVKAVDFDRGKTVSQRTKSQENRYKANLPYYDEEQKKAQSHEAQADEIGILKDLSPQIDASERLNINPFTGEILVPAVASPETQRFVKTINDFTTKAKDSYGARVTNFDLQQFMQRLPTLANSEEGRRYIIEQMEIINNIDREYSRALNEVIGAHGGIRNIDWDVAKDLANKRAKPQVEKLKKQLTTIGTKANSSFQKTAEEYRKMTPKGHTAVMKNDGDIGYISNEKLKDFLAEKGNKKL